MLPRLNGYDVCRGLRAADVWTPVMMLSAKDGEYDQVDAFDLGADDYLVKPFAFPVLVARLRAPSAAAASPAHRSSPQATSAWTPRRDRYAAAASSSSSPRASTASCTS